MHRRKVSNANPDGDNTDLPFFLKKENVTSEGLRHKKPLNFVSTKKHIKPSTFNLNAVSYFRQTSDDVESSPSLPLSRDMDTEQELDQDERYRMVDLGADGSLSGNESGISLEEGNDEASAVAELRPLRVSAIPTSKVTAKAKLKSNSKETEI